MPKIETFFVVGGDGVSKHNISGLANLFRGTEQGREVDYEIFVDEDEADARFQRRENEGFLAIRLKAMDAETFSTVLEFFQSLGPDERLRRIVHTSR